MKCLAICILLGLVGCLHPRVATPYLKPRVCPANSVAHVAIYRGQPRQICVDNRTQGIFDIATGYNPYENVDGDEGLSDKKPPHKHWWKFWERNGEDAD